MDWGVLVSEYDAESFVAEQTNVPIFCQFFKTQKKMFLLSLDISPALRVPHTDSYTTPFS